MVRLEMISDPRHSNGEFGRRFSIRPETVRRLRRELVAEGRIPPTGR
jgi:hypothetical protein